MKKTTTKRAKAIKPTIVSSVDHLTVNLLSLFDGVMAGTTDYDKAKTLVGISNATCNIARTKVVVAAFNRSSSPKNKIKAITF